MCRRRHRTAKRTRNSGDLQKADTSSAPLDAEPVPSRRPLGACLPDRARRRDALCQPRRAELSPRRGDHRGADPARQLHRHAQGGQGLRVEPASLLHARLGLDEGLRDRRIRAALALRLFRPRDGPGRVRHRRGALQQARRPDRGHPGGGQPDADLVLAGGPLLRGPGLLLRRLSPFLRPSPAHPQWSGPLALGARLGARPHQPLLRLLPGRDRGRLAARRAASSLASPPTRRRRRRGGRGGPDAVVAGPGQPHPYRLDRKEPPLHPLLRDRGQLPGR